VIIDHVGIYVENLDRMAAFYDAALAPLGIQRLMQFPAGIGFGKDGKAELWLHGPNLVYSGKTRPHVHLALVADSRGAVDAFYAAAIAAGAKDNGPPGKRELYHPNYYGAFVLDPEGHNLEAVIHHV
jgi:catechol 2,3-dioxygenase-like lactoylglutathione lyase family enzyme